MNQPIPSEPVATPPSPPMLASEGALPWYYGVGQHRVGPVDAGSFLALIAAAQVRPETLVWRPGMTQWIAAQQIPELATPLAAAAGVRASTPPVQPGYVGVEVQSDATGGLIPYKNGAALAGYYLSIVALVPGLGLLLSPVAIWLGVKGLRAVKREPLIKGSVHAWIGIGLGSVVLMMHILALALMIIAIAT
jgi:hypothetical protein